MTERDQKSGSESNRDGPPPNDESIIPGRHGKHGGSVESEGAPQEQSPEAPRPSTANGSDHNRH
jgi:hypothetical protein